MYNIKRVSTSNTLAPRDAKTMKNPRDLTPDQFEQEVRTVVKGSITPAEAEERLKQHFSPQPPFFWVQKRGEDHLGVLAQQRIGAENVDIICER